MDEEKKILRNKAKQCRQAAFCWDQEHGDTGKTALRDAFLRRYQPESGLIVAGYVARESEIDPRPLLETLASMGLRLALPVVAEKGGVLSFRLWDPNTPLETGTYNIPTPPRTAPLVEPDILLVPLLAYDASRHRLGYGGGYYDRTLAHLRSLKKIQAIGVAYLAQAFPYIPATSTDEALDDIIAVSLPLGCGSDAPPNDP